MTWLSVRESGYQGAELARSAPNSNRPSSKAPFPVTCHAGNALFECSIYKDLIILWTCPFKAVLFEDTEKISHDTCRGSPDHFTMVTVFRKTDAPFKFLRSCVLC